MTGEGVEIESSRRLSTEPASQAHAASAEQPTTSAKG